MKNIENKLSIMYLLSVKTRVLITNMLIIFHAALLSLNFNYKISTDFK